MSIRKILAAFFLASALTSPTLAQETQQVAPPPGSPGATITIPGDQLPPPPQKFGGKIERNARDSKALRRLRILSAQEQARIYLEPR
jgi:hypothetical protein